MKRASGRTRWAWGAGCLAAAAILAAAATAAVARAAEPAKAAAPPPIRTVVLVGGHGYDAKNFSKAWSGHDDIQAEVWPGKPWTVLDDISNFKYDVIVMYTLASGMTEKERENLLALLKRGVGLVVWHHALANCQDWPEWDKLAGARYWLKAGKKDGRDVPPSGYKHGVDLKMHIEDPRHPITRGMTDFEIHDEAYNKQTFEPDIHVLVSTDNPASDKPIAWIPKTPKEIRVFAYQGGHDATAWTNEGHRALLAQGIRWVARRLDETSAAAEAKP